LTGFTGLTVAQQAGVKTAVNPVISIHHSLITDHCTLANKTFDMIYRINRNTTGWSQNSS
jgi:hypothetical protein